MSTGTNPSDFTQPDNIVPPPPPEVFRVSLPAPDPAWLESLPPDQLRLVNLAVELTDDLVKKLAQHSAECEIPELEKLYQAAAKEAITTLTTYRMLLLAPCLNDDDRTRIVGTIKQKLQQYQDLPAAVEKRMQAMTTGGEDLIHRACATWDALAKRIEKFQSDHPLCPWMTGDTITAFKTVCAIRKMTGDPETPIEYRLKNAVKLLSGAEAFHKSMDETERLQCELEQLLRDKERERDQGQGDEDDDDEEGEQWKQGSDGGDPETDG